MHKANNRIIASSHYLEDLDSFIMRNWRLLKLSFFYNGGVLVLESIVSKEDEISAEERILWKKTRNILLKGNDAEIRLKKDGTVVVYEIRKQKIAEAHCLNN